jgi:hypothetical protein
VLRSRSMKDQTLRFLRRDIARLPSGRRRRFPLPLRARIMSWTAGRRASGAEWRELAEQLGVPAVTLQSWQALASSRTSSPRLVPVEVLEEPSSTTMTLVSPTGWRIEGLPLALVAQLLRGPG